VRICEECDSSSFLERVLILSKDSSGNPLHPLFISMRVTHGASCEKTFDKGNTIAILGHFFSFFATLSCSIVSIL